MLDRLFAWLRREPAAARSALLQPDQPWPRSPVFEPRMAPPPGHIAPRPMPPSGRLQRESAILWSKAASSAAALSDPPSPQPGQIWRRADEHGGDLTMVVEGEGEPGVWYMTGFNWFKGNVHADIAPGWVRGCDRLFRVEDFKTATYVGDLPYDGLDRARAAIATLERMRYAWHGGELWAPPLGQVPAWVIPRDLPDSIETSEAEALPPPALVNGPGVAAKWGDAAPLFVGSARDPLLTAMVNDGIVAARPEDAPVNVAGPEHLAPEPADGLAFDHRGVLVPIAAAAPADSVPMPQNADQAAGMAMVGIAWLKANAPDRLKSAAPEDAPPCPMCEGSGEVTATTSHLGPDDYDFQDNCPHCGGTGELADAYRGVVKLLETERADRSSVSAKLWGAAHARKIAAWRYRNASGSWTYTEDGSEVAAQPWGTARQSLYPSLEWEEMRELRLTPEAAAYAQTMGALRDLQAVVIEQNRLGTSWHSDVFPKLMTALSRAAAALAGCPQGVDNQAGHLLALAGWLDCQALNWEATGVPGDDEDLLAVRSWAALVRSLAAAAPTAREDAIAASGRAQPAPTPQAAEPDASAEAKRLRDALVELTRLEPPETVPANIRVVVYGADARDYALQVLNTAPPQPAAAPEDAAGRVARLDSQMKASIDRYMSPDQSDLDPRLVAAASALLASSRAQQGAPVAMCSCGDRPLSQCPGEWEQGCDLGANEKFAVTTPPLAGDKLDAALDLKLISIRLPVAMVEQFKALAVRAGTADWRGVGYQPLMRQALSDFLAGQQAGRAARSEDAVGAPRGEA
jgi:hypothetical protein